MRPIFPSRRHTSAKEYLEHYTTELTAALASIDDKQLEKALAILEEAQKRDATIFFCGNGGSAGIANHMVCDHQKGVSVDTHLRPRVVSLASNVEILTAVANDIGFGDVFAMPLRLHARKGDVLLAISSSGGSENIVRVLDAAKELGLHTIALTGFDGGRCRPMADACIHVDGNNYGVVEDAHQAVMHVMAQYLRHNVIAAEHLGQKRF